MPYKRYEGGGSSGRAARNVIEAAPGVVSIFSEVCSPQEWPRQTKPTKGQFMNFSQGHSGTKIQCEIVLVCLRKNTRIHTKMGEVHELCVSALSWVWFAGATPDSLCLEGCSSPEWVLGVWSALLAVGGYRRNPKFCAMVVPYLGWIGNGPNTVSGSTVSDAELSEFFLGSLSSGERTQ